VLGYIASLLGKQLNSILISLDGIMRVAQNVQRHQSQMVLAIDVHADKMLMLHWLSVTYLKFHVVD